MLNPTHRPGRAAADRSETADELQFSGRQMATLLFSVFIIAVCGLVYELIVGTLSSYLMGSSVTHFSITIGLFLSAMGLGAWLSRFVKDRELHWFVLVEIITGLVGGVSALLLFSIFALTPYFYPAMVLLIGVIGACIGMEIPLLTRLANGTSGLRLALANVFAFDYLGALIGSVAFPLLLLPLLGILNTAFVIGLVNLLVAGAILWAFRAHLRHWTLLVTLTAIGFIGLNLGLVSSSHLENALQNRLYRDPVVLRRHTRYQQIVMTAKGEDIRLFINGNLQFSLRDEYRYHEALVHPAMSLAPHRQRVLILGGGDGLALREILKYPDVQEVVLVDIDPAMTELARSHLALRRANAESMRDPRLHVVNADAFTYLGQGDDLFQVIIADLPDPNDEALSKLYSRSSYRLMRRRLAGDGILVTQATSPFFGRRAFWTIAATIAAEDLQTLPYHTYVPSFGDWGFVLASPRPIAPETYAPRVPVRFFTPAAFGVARVFDSDTDANVDDVRPSTLNDPVVLHHYQEAERAWY